MTCKTVSLVNMEGVCLFATVLVVNMMLYDVYCNQN